MKNKFLSRIGQWGTPPYLRKCLASLKSLILLLVMLMSVNVWGADVTFDFKALATNTSGTVDGIGWGTGKTGSATATACNATNGLVLYGVSSGGGYFNTTSATSGKITGVALVTTAKKNTPTYTAYGSTDGTNWTSIEAGIATGEKNLDLSSASYTYFKIENTTGATAQLGVSSIKITYAGSAKTLSSIAISGTPNKTTYETGESFDVSDLTVTGTYSDKSTSDLTDDAEWTIDPATFTSTSQPSVSVTATVGEKSDTKQYNVTVTEHVVTPGTYEIVPNNTFFGIEVQTTGKHDPVTGKQNDITLIHSGGSSFYCNATQVRTYKDNTLTFSVPAGYEITSIVLDVTDNASYNADNGTYTASSKTWAGHAQQVVLTSAQSSGNYQITKITVTYVVAKTLSGIAVKTAPTVVNYAAGEFFNPAGLVITATYDDETTADIAYEGNEDKFSFSPALDVALATTDEKVTITYGDKSCDQTITVKNIELTSIVVSGDLSKTEYTEGDDFDFTGLVATGYYSDESHKTITDQVDWSIDPATLTAGQTSVSVIATSGLISGNKSYDITVAKAPSIVTWDLSIVDDELTTATEDKLEWTNAVATMTDTRKDSKSTAANNYYPGTPNKSYTSTRFYGGSVLTVAPVDNNTITKVEFTATSNSYATALKNSTWTNATSGDPVQIGTSDSYSLTVTPTDGKQAFSATIGGTCGFTAVKVYYQPGATMTSIAVKTAPSKVVYNAGESFNPAGLVITATYDDETTADIAYDANDTKWEFLPDLTDKLDATDNEVIISYNNVLCDDALEITVNRIASNLAAVSATKILTIDDAPSLADWYTVDANYDGTVSFQSDDEEVFYVEGAEGLALAAGSATLTITAPQTDTYAQASVTVAVTVNAAAVPCSVKWMNNGEEYTVGGPSTVVNAGQKVTKLPTAPEPCDAQHVFKGWTNAIIATPQADAPSILFTDAASAPTVDADNTVYYAVYAIESIDEDIDSYTFTGVGTITEGVATLTTSSGNTIRMDKGEGSTNPAWSSNQARLYAKGLMTVSSSETISKIVYSYTVNANSKGSSPTIDGVAGANNAGSWDSESKTWTGSDTEVTFSTSGTAGNVGFTNVTIYGEPIITYSDYSTTCAAIELDAIELGGTYPTTFLVGDEFSHEGMTVTASYKNSATTKDVTNLATFTDKATGEAVDMSAVGSKTILVSYTEDENTKTAEYDITINDWPNKTIQEFIAAQGVKCYLTAFVSNLDGSNYDLTDNSGTIHGYKYTLADGVSALANGDRIRVRAEEYTTYQDAPEVKNIVVLEKLAFSAIAVSGTMNVTEYTEGNTLNSDGLVVKGKYADEDEATHVITEGITWTMPTAVLGTSEYDVTATVGTLTSPAYHVTGITVNAAKVLTGITIVTEPKKTFWVGENFSTTGIQVTASYDGAEDADVTTLCTFSRAEAQITDAIVNETITVSYTEGTETKTATYTINANWMTLADLVENITPTGTAVKVWVKITDALVKARNNSYLTTDVTYGDSQTKEVKIYKSGVDATWVAGGTISGELKDVDWKLFNSDWELMPSDWTWATYTPAAPTPVTGVSLNESAIEVKVGKTATLVATVTPDNATDKSVTWSIINDNANGKVTVDQTGLVTVAADAVEGATATIQVTTTNGGFTATCNVTVTVPVVSNYYLVTDASTLHAGDIIVLAATKDDQSYVNGDLSGDYLTRVETIITDDLLSTADACEFVLGGEEGAWTLTSVNGALGATAAKKLTYDDTKTGFVGTWTISIDEDNNATIAPDAEDYGKFLYNVNSPRFLTYTSATSTTMLLPQLYRKYETIRTDMTDGQIGTGCQTKNIYDVKGATLYQVNYTYGCYLEFMEVTYPVAAGMPIIIQADGTNDGKVEVLYGNEVATEGSNKDGLYGYIGSGQFNIPEGSPYYVFKGGMLRPSQGNYTTSGHAYIKLDEVPTEDQTVGSPAPRRRLSVGVERSMPTGFETIMMQKGMNKVIMNNQLFIIRDGKLFNAQGALVK
ncbi:MAG: Ig-like domain-containing protein [Paludibacteraceae bacterium]|nr:Ig-like domain-containing protein [Paludibacteraceae bacterium]